jgi:hypothetical protein
MAKGDAVLFPAVTVVRPAVDEEGNHSRNALGVDGSVEADDPSKAAHASSLTPDV